MAVDLGPVAEYTEDAVGTPLTIFPRAVVDDPIIEQSRSYWTRRAEIDLRLVGSGTDESITWPAPPAGALYEIVTLPPDGSGDLALPW